MFLFFSNGSLFSRSSSVTALLYWCTKVFNVHLMTVFPQPTAFNESNGNLQFNGFRSEFLHQPSKAVLTAGLVLGLQSDKNGHFLFMHMIGLSRELFGPSCSWDPAGGHACITIPPREIRERLLSCVVEERNGNGLDKVVRIVTRHSCQRLIRLLAGWSRNEGAEGGRIFAAH